eukprot:2707438-Rhodomonas_salina.2
MRSALSDRFTAAGPEHAPRVDSIGRQRVPDSAWRQRACAEQQLRCRRVTRREFKDTSTHTSDKCAELALSCQASISQCSTAVSIPPGRLSSSSLTRTTWIMRSLGHGGRGGGPGRGGGGGGLGGGQGGLGGLGGGQGGEGGEGRGGGGR